MYKVGDTIITKPNFFHLGEDIGDRLGKVIDTKGHILIELFCYDSNPVKCFTYEIEPLGESPRSLEITEEEINEFLGDLP